MRLPDLAEILIRVLGDDDTRRALDALCKEAGGETLYIPSRPARPDRSDLRPTDTVQTLIQTRGISKSTAYRWVDRWRK